MRTLRALDAAMHVDGIKPGIRDMLAEIIRYLPQNLPFATVFAHKATFAKSMGVTERTVYRHLQQQPGTPRRPLSAYRADLRETMILCSRGRYREAYTVAMAHDP